MDGSRASPVRLVQGLDPRGQRRRKNGARPGSLRERVPAGVHPGDGSFRIREEFQPRGAPPGSSRGESVPSGLQNVRPLIKIDFRIGIFLRTERLVWILSDPMGAQSCSRQLNPELCKIWLAFQSAKGVGRLQQSGAGKGAGG